MNKTGVLLINLGTPDQPNKKAVRRYLKEFLSDPYVIDLPGFVRWFVVNAAILPFRPKHSVQAYQKIWQAKGSPLLIHSQQLTASLREWLGERYQVELGMRYGNPSLSVALARLQHCQRLIILPLFPQYSSAVTGSAIAKTWQLLDKRPRLFNVTIIEQFYNDADFISAYATHIKKNIQQQAMDIMLFSYHGLPQRHIKKNDCATGCDKLAACPATHNSNQHCYRAQCYTTSRLLAQALNLASEDYVTTFQSRLGKTSWIKPYTDKVLIELIEQGVKDIVIVCPSFVADCLETLEEIAIRAKQQWLTLGGRSLRCIPCLNAEPIWVEALVKLLGRN